MIWFWFLMLVCSVIAAKFSPTNVRKMVITGCCAVLLLLLPFCFLAVIPAGHVGILTFFGKVYDQVPEGLNAVNPFSQVHTMSVRTQELFEHSKSPSAEGLNINMEVSLLYRLDSKAAWIVYRNVGLDYQKVIVQPSFRSAIRGATVNHDAKDLYTSGRELISQEIISGLTLSLKDRGLILEKVLLRKIELPPAVQDSIDAKLSADQDSQRMVFVLLKEKQEAERKRIEAQGIQDFQKIVSQGISEQLLRWKGIEATEHLAKSPNAKIIVVGGKDGLPLILNSGKD